MSTSSSPASTPPRSPLNSIGRGVRALLTWLIKKPKQAVVFIIALLVIFFAASTWLNFQAVKKPISTATEQWSFEVKSGDSLQSVARRLKEKDIIRRAKPLVTYAKYTRNARNIQAGEYLIDGSQSPQDILTMMTEGRVRMHQVTFVEGWTAQQILAALSAHSAIKYTLGDISTSELGHAVGMAGDQNLEGWIYPDTYRFYKGDTDIKLLTEAHKRMKQKLDEAWSTKQDHLPFENPYQVLILASIVEKETGVDDERPRIAGVFIERINKGMRLQTDPTVIYGLGESFDGNLTRRDLESDTPYNT
ncbi:MAG: endolytic transglycosylase MltG, partial [Gammaproteobacteria bacterium]|nr:endolytic transglycosylase MltG [Gammaproteobacteria bacterium]